MSTSIAILLGLGIAVTVIGLVFLTPISKALGASNDTLPFAYVYSKVLFIGAIIIMFNYAVGQLLRSEGSIMPSIFGMLIGTVINIILDPIFIFALDMGIEGAAIATVIGQACGLLFYLIYYISGKSIVKFKLNKISTAAIIWKQIWFIGIPAALSQLLMSVAMIFLNNLAANYGDNIVAAMGVASKIMTIGTFIFMGFAAGCQPLVGFNYGAGNNSRLNSILKAGMLLTSSIGVALMVIFWLSAKGIISVFTDLPEVIADGTVILKSMIWSLPFLGAQMLATTTVQAMGKSAASLFLSILRQGVLFIPLMYLLNYLFAFNGLIYTQPLVDLLSMTVALAVLQYFLKSKSVNQNDVKTACQGKQFQSN